jgi:lipoprotein-anchoring transpeptidase ErfK/SrfK
MAASADEAQAGLAYAGRALEINPRSGPARKAVDWCMKRIPRADRRAAARQAHLPSDLSYQIAPLEALTVRRLFSPQAMLPALALVIGLGLWFGGQPADAKQPQVGPAQVEKASPTPTPTDTPTPTETPTPRPNVSWDYTENPADLADEGRWVDVDLSEQKVVAYEGADPIRTFIVSTGLPGHPTVTGQFRIYVKLRSTPMSGPGYYLPGVPFTMYFYKGYALHGTYWHHNFGHPMSHGCVNLATPDAEWLFDFASVGTLVNVHP